MQPAERVEDGAVQERRAVGGHERVQPLAGALAELEVIALREQAKRRVGQPALDVEVARAAQRGAQLLGVVGIRQRGVLVEPLGRQHLGRRPPRLAAVLQRDARAREHLRGLGQRDDAEAKGQAQADVALEERHLAHAQRRRH